MAASDADTDPDLPVVPLHVRAGGRTRDVNSDVDGINVTTVVRLHPDTEHELLSFDYRQIGATLREHGRLSVAEISTRLGMPVVTVAALVTELRWQNRVILHVPETHHSREFLQRVLDGIHRL